MLDELRKWAEIHAPLGHVQARQVLELLDRHDHLKEACNTMNNTLNARIRELETELAAAKKTSLQLAERMMVRDAELLAARTRQPVRIATPSFPPQSLTDEGR
jgi:hypothetical protein